MSVPGRRNRLISAAPAVFVAHGYAETSLQDLGDAVGCSRSSLHRDFASKDELLAAVAEPLLEEIETLLGSFSVDLRAEEDRASVIRGYLVILGAHRDVSKVLLTDDGARRTPVGERVMDQQRSLVARLTGPRATLRQQVRARCGLAISHLMVGELSSVPAHRLRAPLLEAAIDMLSADQGSSPSDGGARDERAPLPVSDL